jgi:hypothetical protein
MGSTHARLRLLVGLAATAGAFGAAAMMSAAAAPTAHADDITDIVNAVEGDYADGQSAFTTAVSEFGINQFPTGLADLIDGVDDDSVSVANNIVIGAVEALTNASISSSYPTTFDVPTSFSDALTGEQAILADGESFLTDAASFFAAGNYGYAAVYDLTGADYLTIYPLQELLLGVSTSF